MESPLENSADETHRRVWLAGIIVFAVAFAGMSRICSNQFVDWDDSFTLYANPKMNPPTKATLWFYWTHAEHGLYIPATQTVWAALSAIAWNEQPDARGIRLDPRVFHTASVVLHALASVVAFLLLRRLLASNGQARPSGRGPSLAAAIGALLFALHPVQVESVAWTAGMKDVLCGLFSLIALWQYVAAVQAGKVMHHRFLLATLAFIIAMLCKPSAMVLPALAMIIHVVLLGASWKDAARWTALWWPMAIAIMIVARVSQPITQAPTPLWLRPLVATDALAFYAGKIIAPLKLCIDYGRSPSVAQDSGWLYVTWLIPAAIAGLLIWKPRRQLIAAALIALVCVAPVLGLTPFMFQYFSTVADHYLYLAMLGPALLLAWLVMTGKPLIRPAAMIVLVFFAAQSLVQQSTWRDNEALFEHTLAINPNSFMAANNLASAHTVAAEAFELGARMTDELGDRKTAQTYRAQARENHARAAELYAHAIELRKRVNRGIDDHVTARRALETSLAKVEQLAQPPTSPSASAN